MTYLSDAIAAAYTALSAAGGLSGVRVEQGQQPSAEYASEFVIVGHDGSYDPDGSLAEFTEAGSFITQFVYDGAPPGQQETGTVSCVVVTQSGDATDLAGPVTRAEELLGACTSALTDLHVNGNEIVFDQATRGRLVTRQGSQGCGAMYSFDIGYSAPWND